MKTHWILHRTGGVFSSFEGNIEQVNAECARLNATDVGGTTEIQAGFQTLEEAESELARLEA